jgi:hypothetical protein
LNTRTWPGKPSSISARVATPPKVELWRLLRLCPRQGGRRTTSI